MIHVDQDVAIHRALGIDQSDAAGKVLWDLGAGVALVRELLQRDAVRLVVARRMQREFPTFARAGKPCGAPSASDTSHVPSEADVISPGPGCGTISITALCDVVRVGGGGARQFLSRRSRAPTPWLAAGLMLWRRLVEHLELGILIKMPDDNPERQTAMLDGSAPRRNRPARELPSPDRIQAVRLVGHRQLHQRRNPPCSFSSRPP